jgi:uncharacterized membrane protein YccC
MPATWRQVAGSALHVEWSQFEGAGALRCTAGVAIPLAAGLLLNQPALSAFGAVGAVSVGFGSFQGAYRSRAAVMISAAVAMGLSVVAGSLAGHSDVATIAVASIVAFAGSLVVALGPAAGFVGLQAVVAALIASGFPAAPRQAALLGAMVFAGGLAQTLLVALLWPLRRFAAERAAVADAYRSLAGYARTIPADDSLAPPEPHTFAATRSPLSDPQPFARAGEVLVFQALLDEAERIRASLAALVTRQRDLGAEEHCRRAFFDACAAALAEIAAALHDGRDPHDGAGTWDALDRGATTLPGRVLVEALLGQLRAAWRIAGVLSADPRDRPPADRLPPLRQRPPIREALTTLGANLTLRSTACRHALRVTAAVASATVLYRLLHWPRGYWMPMTALLVLKPEFHDTLKFGLARIAGTIAGALLATAITALLAPGHGALTVLVLVFVWACYALFRINYAIFTVCLTAYVVFILMLSGVGELTAATLRAEYTLAGGLLALILYGVWPTWAGTTARAALAALLDAHGAYVSVLLGGFAEPARIDLSRLAALRASARLARSNAEAVLERMLSEPARRAALAPRVAVGILAALRRHALAALALHAGLERGVAAPVPGMALLRDQMTVAVATLADAVRNGTASAPLADLRSTQLALGASDALVNAETDLMVDSINTIASLLAQQARQDML